MGRNGLTFWEFSGIVGVRMRGVEKMGKEIEQAIAEASANFNPDIRERDKRRGTGQRRFDIKQLWNQNHEILRLSFLGWRNIEIAKRLNISPITVSNTINSTLGQKKLQNMREKRDSEVIGISEKIANLAEGAVKVYEEIIKDDEGRVSMSLKKNTADTILKDILGHQAPKKVEGKFAHAHLDSETIETIKQRHKEAAAAAGILAEE